MLARWEDERTFERLREQNADGPRFSFVDGPITANNPMGVHHAWGRTLKDVFQRYKAQRGFHERYQNGFDCQGLWVEVEVERALGLNSKHEIEEYGLAEFAERCKERVAEYGEVITEQSKRLGMWMDWDTDYYTFSDTNIEYIWRFLKTVHERGGSTSDIARPSGALAAGRRSRSTNSSTAVQGVTTRPSSSDSRSPTVRASRSSSGRRRRGRCPRTSRPPCALTRSTGSQRRASGWPWSAARMPSSSSGAPEPSSSAGRMRGRSTISTRRPPSSIA